MVKKFEFWRVRLGETPVVAPPIFVTFSLFLISTHFKSLIHLALTVRISKSWRTRLRGISQPGTFDFCHTLVPLDIFNPSNFEYSAFSGLKVDTAEENKTRKKVDKRRRKQNKKKKSLYQQSACINYQVIML